MTIDELMGYKLRDGYLLVQPMTAPDKIGSIILPDKYANEQPIGKVVSKTNGGDDVEHDDWVLYRRAKATDFNRWEMDDNKTVSLVQECDILGILQPDGIIPLGRNVVVEQVDQKKSVIEVVDNSELIDEEYIVANVVERGDVIDTVKPGDKVVMRPKLVYFQVEFKDKTYFVCDIDELEAVVV